MSEGQELLPRRRPAVGAVDDLDIRPANPDGERLHQDGAVLGRRLGHVGEGDGVLLKGNNGDGAHRLTVVT